MPADWLDGAVNRIGRRTNPTGVWNDGYEARAKAMLLGFANQRDQADAAARANALARWDTANFVLPPDTVQRNLPTFSNQFQNDQDLKTVNAVPKMQPWLTDPRNAAAAVGPNLGPLAALSSWFGQPAGGATYDYYGVTRLGRERSMQERYGQVWKPQSSADIVRSAIFGPNLDEQRAQDIADNRPGANAGSVFKGLAVDTTQGFKQVYYSTAMYLLDAMGAGDSRDFAEYKDAFLNSRDIADSWRPVIQNGFLNSVYGGATSFLQTAPALLLAPFTDGASLLTIIGAQTGVQAYGKYRARGATPNEALLGGGLEGAIEAGTEALPVGVLYNRFGKGSLGHFAAEYLGKEMLGEQIATAGQDAVDTAIANPTATWAQYIADRPQAAFDTAIATVMATGAVAGASGVYHAMRRDTQEVQNRIETIAGAGFLDQVVSLAGEAPMAKTDPKGFAQYLQGQTEGTPINNVYIPAEKVRSLFQEAGKDYKTDPFWKDYAGQIDQASPIAGDVVIPLGEAVTHFVNTASWDTWRDSVRLSPGGMSLAESRAIEASYGEIMGQRGAEAAAHDRASAEATAPQQRVYDEVLSQARQSGVSLNAARTYADLFATRYATRAAQQGTDAWTLFNKSVGGIVSDMPSSLRPYERADSLDVLVNAMRRDKAAPSDASVKGPSLLQFISGRGGIEDRTGDLSAMNAEKWHKAQPFRRKLLKEVEGQGQGELRGVERGATDNSPERLFQAAIDEGYFPELIGRETTESDYSHKADLQTFYDAISAELQGSPTYAEDKANTGKGADASIRTAADDLRGFLDQRGIDPDTASIDDIRSALAETESTSPVAATFEQWRAWNDPPPGMSDLVLHHNGPSALPKGRPTGKNANYFGTAEFSDAMGRDFGDWRYTFWVPHAVADRIIDLGAARDGNVDEASRAFAAEVARRQWPDEPEYAEGLERGDPLAWADFYETWADSANLSPLLTELGYTGARFDNEFMLLPDAIEQLVDRRNGPDDGTISFYQSQPNQPTFYSALTRAVEAGKITKGDAAQWRSTLLNTPGVKAEEVEWSGLLEWLDEQPGAISRTDVQQFLESGGIRVTEVIVGDAAPLSIAAERTRLYEDWVERHTLQILSDSDAEFPGINEDVEEVEDGFRFDGWTYDTLAEAEGVRDDAVANAEREWEADQRSEIESQVRRMRDEEDFDSEAKEALGAVTQFGPYTSTGEATPSYRELLITLPLGKGTNPRKAPDTHWSQPAVVAHTRFQAKRDAEGRPVLFVEEVQSDWHQKGRDQGYEVPAPPAVIEAARAKVAEAEQAWIAAQRAILAYGHEMDVMPPDDPPKPSVGFDGFVLKDQPLDERASYADVGLARFSRGERSYGRDPGEFGPERREQIERIAELRAAYKNARLANDEAQQGYANAMRTTGIPQAPFKKTWPALVMKRLIRWAADNGYHSVAWTTGEEQSERYGLSSAVGSIATYQHSAGDGSLMVFEFGVPAVTDLLLSNGAAEGTVAGKPYSAVMTRDQAVASFGELGGRAFDAGKDAEASAPAMFDGSALEVGGEGMKAFYDRNLVNITNDLIKKHGAKVAQIDVRGPTDRADRMLAEVPIIRRQADEFVREGAERAAERLYDEANAAEETAKTLHDASLSKQWGFEVTPSLREAAQQGFSLFQGGESKPRGRIDFGKDGRATIRLFEGRDLSTLLHEGSHLWLEELRADANMADAPQQVKDDWKTVRKWFKQNGFAFAEGGTIPTDAHEMWARGMERYFMEGKAPTSALAKAFSSMRSWLLRIYKVVANLNAPITDDVRRVFDRMLATEQEIAKAQTNDEQALAFTSAAEGRMTDAEFAAYVESSQTVRTEAFDALLFKTMASIRAERTAEWKAQRDVVRREVDEQVRNRPEFRALAMLRSRDPAKRMQLNREALVESYGSDALALLPRGVPPTIVDQGGVHPDILANAAGFKTGQEMIDMLIGVETRQRELRMAQDRRSVLQETIDLGTDTAMRERYGDPLADGSIEEEALAAINSDKRSAIIASEIRYLSRRTKATTGEGTQVPTPLSLAREWAERVVREGKVSEEATAASLLRHQRNEAKAARAAQEAILAGDADTAFVEKQRQLYHHELWRAAKAAKDQVDAIVKRLGRYAKSTGMKSIDPDYFGRITDLLAAYDFRPRSRAERAERGSFADWVAAKALDGEEVPVPPRLRDFDKLNFKDATVEDLIGLDDAVQSIAHLGRRKKKLMLAKEEADFEETVDAAVSTAGALKSLPVSDQRNPKPGLRGRARGLDATLIKIEFMADQLDMGDPNGVFNEVLVKGAQTAASKKTQLVSSVLKPLADLYNGMSKAQQRRLRDRVSVPELVTRNKETGEEVATVFERSEILSIALNIGSESSLQKLLRGESRIVSKQNAWTTERVQAVLDRELNEEDWRFVEKVWRVVDGLWPDVVRAEKEITGLTPEKVVPRTVQTKFGPIEGGYYPAVYDPTRSAIAEANYEDDAAKMFGQTGRVVSTPKGHTITRTEFAAPMMLSLEGVLFNHVNKVATRIAYGRYARDTLKFIKHPKIKEVVDTKMGREYRRQLQPWLQRQINDASLDTNQLAALDKLMRGFRVNATMVGLGLRLTTMYAQLGGLANSISYLGPKYAALGVADTIRNIGHMREFVFSRSPMMAERATEFDRDVRTFFSDLRNTNGPLNRFRGMAYWGIGNVQLFTVDMPTWFGAYRKSLDEGMTDDQAVAAADKRVRKSQSSGRAADLSAIQDSAEGYRVMTLFYSFWNVFYNQQRETVHAARTGDWRRASMNVFWIMMVAPVFSAFLTGDWPDDDSDESVFHWAMRKMFFGLWAGLPMIREIAGGLERKSIGKRALSAQTPVARAVDALSAPIGDAWAAGHGDAPSDRWVQNAVTAPGYFFGLPTGQAGNTAQYLYDVGKGNQHPEGVGDVLWGVTKGPQKDQEGAPSSESDVPLPPPGFEPAQ